MGTTIYFTSNETCADEWVDDTFRWFPDATYYHTTSPRYLWRGDSDWFTLTIGNALVVVASDYEDGIWQVWSSIEDYLHGEPFAVEGIFDCAYADMNQEHWDEYVAAIEEYSGL